MPKKPAAPAVAPPLPREPVHDRLKAIAVGLSTDDKVSPILRSLCFVGRKGGKVYAFNEKVAAVAKFDAPFEGAVRGKVFLDWLGAVTGKDLMVEPTEEALSIRCGRARLELPLMAASEFVFEEPIMGADAVTAGDDFPALLRDVALCLGTEPGQEWAFGLTMLFGKTSVELFTSDNVISASATAAAKVPKALRGKAVLVPPQFVPILLKVGKGDAFKVGEQWLSMKSGDVTYYGRLGDAVSVKTYREIMEGVREAGKTAKTLPPTWWGIMRRHVGILAGEKDQVTQFTVADDKLTVLSRGGNGQAKDTATFGGKVGTFDVKVLPDVLMRVPKSAGRIALVASHKLAFIGKTARYAVHVLGE